MRAGMDHNTGRVLTGWDHCAQSLAIILTTRVGTRVMRRSFGSEALALQDRNPDSRTILAGFVAIASAIRAFEPGFRLNRIIPERIAPDGVAVFTLSGDFFPRGHLGDYTTRERRSTRIAGSQSGWRVA